MWLLPRRRKRPKHITKIGILPETKKFKGIRYTKHATMTSSKVEANQKVKKLREEGKKARKVWTKDGWAIYSRSKDV